MDSDFSKNINPLDLYNKNQLCSISANMWTRPATALLIEMYRKLECLWKTNSLYYRHKKKRLEALQEIVTVVTPFRPDTTVEDVKGKINGIRTQYVAEVNKVRAFAERDPPVEYEPTLWCYDRLSFLTPYTSLKNKINLDASTITTNSKIKIQQHGEKVQIKQEISDIVEHDLSSCDESEQAQEIAEFNSPQPTKRVRLISQEENDICDGQNIFLTPSTRTEKTPKFKRKKNEDDEIDCSKSDEMGQTQDDQEGIEVFGKFVTSQMKFITNKKLLLMLQHSIQTAIMDAQLKQIELDDQM